MRYTLLYASAEVEVVSGLHPYTTDLTGLPAQTNAKTSAEESLCLISWRNSRGVVLVLADQCGANSGNICDLAADFARSVAGKVPL
ncbi:hypothetical protein HNR73_002175 [Phytomonospora endophytica]|uniref:Uncharacterized protein n=1 Tax=Phytomonospora endophytica TaxID=714109 RepID=A0A841FFF9_9ACTN|nr:hypothetical protein [Phytomonospora endophytica]